MWTWLALRFSNTVEAPGIVVGFFFHFLFEAKCLSLEASLCEQKDAAEHDILSVFMVGKKNQLEEMEAEKSGKAAVSLQVWIEVTSFGYSG